MTAEKDAKVTSKKTNTVAKVTSKKTNTKVVAKVAKNGTKAAAKVTAKKATKAAEKKDTKVAVSKVRAIVWRVCITLSLQNTQPLKTCSLSVVPLRSQKEVPL